MKAGGFAGLRALTLDVGGTLLEPHPSVGEIYARALARRGLAADAAALEARFRAAFRELRSPPRAELNEAAERANWREIVRRSLGDSCPVHALDAVFAELWETFARAASWRPRPGVATGLARLRSTGLPLYVFSNWDARLRRTLAELGWDKLFADIFLSTELGAEKPHPAAFARVQERLGAAPAEILHVGDSPAHDYNGARAAGWRATLITRTAGNPDDATRFSGLDLFALAFTSRPAQFHLK